MPSLVALLERAAKGLGATTEVEATQRLKQDAKTCSRSSSACSKAVPGGARGVGLVRRKHRRVDGRERLPERGHLRLLREERRGLVRPTASATDLHSRRMSSPRSRRMRASSRRHSAPPVGSSRSRRSGRMPKSRRSTTSLGRSRSVTRSAGSRGRARSRRSSGRSGACSTSSWGSQR